MWYQHDSSSALGKQDARRKHTLTICFDEKLKLGERERKMFLERELPSVPVLPETQDCLSFIHGEFVHGHKGKVQATMTLNATKAQDTSSLSACCCGRRQKVMNVRSRRR